MKLPSFFITTTAFSKLLTFFLFITLPFIAFYLGIQYQKKLTFLPDSGGSIIYPSKIKYERALDQPHPTPPYNTTNWQQTYENHKGGYSFRYPRELFIKDMTIGESELSVAKAVSLFSDTNYSNALVTFSLNTSRTFDRSKEFLNMSLGYTETKTETFPINVGGKDSIKGMVVTSVFDSMTKKLIKETREYQVLIPIFSGSQTLIVTSSESMSNMVDQILTTFRFLDDKPYQDYASYQLVSVRYVGGLCPQGVCSIEKLILRDGSSETVNGVKGTLVDLVDILELINLVDTADYEKIRSKKFTGVCPAAYDGQEVIYTFYTLHGIEQISSCTIEIDPDLPLFSKIHEILK